MEYRQLAKVPVPMWGAVCGPLRRHAECVAAEIGPVKAAMYEQQAVACRGVPLDRLPAVLVRGVDVEPADSPIYVDFFDKSSEYGGHPKLVLAYTWDGLEQTFRTLPLDAPDADIERLQATYPHRYEHRGKIWLSRIKDSNPARREYELAHARWIPGDPFACLKAAFVYGSEDDLAWAGEQLGRVAP